MQRGLSLEAVSKVTKIQPRILERLEAGKLEGLPAEVFVRGFVRSVARCVGLDEDEALRRYAACGLGTGTADLTPTVRALVEAMVDLAPGHGATPRATPRRMQAVEAPEILDLASPGMPLTGTGAVVETMMLPETGTVVMPAHLAASASMSMMAVTIDSEPAEALPVAPSTLPAGSFDALPIEAAEAAPAVVAEAAPAVAAEVAPAVVVEAAPPVVVAAVVVAEAVETQTPAIAVAVEPVVDGGKKKRSRRGKNRNKRATDAPAGISRELVATGTPASASPVVPAPSDVAVVAGEVAEPIVTAEPIVASSEPSAMAPSDAAIADEPIATETWAPKMPPIAAAPSVPWRRPAYAAAPAVVVPSLVIDDADPDSAERVLEERAETLAPRRSFLPPILLDREDRSARQGGLTLAVIILLIAATLTLSYLMRRPSASGDGMTRRETPASYVG